MSSKRPASIAFLTLALLWAALQAGAAMAARIVVFDDGRALRVAEFTFRDGMARLELEAGGVLFVPADVVASVEIAAEVIGEPVGTAQSDPLPVDEVTQLARTLEGQERWRAAAGLYADVIAAAADRHGLPRALLAAVAKVESNFDPYAVSPKGACGLLQLMPATARRFGVRNVFDVSQNAEGGARYLRWLLDRFEGDVRLALAGYNAGEGAVERHEGVPPYRETRAYVVRVLDDASASER